MPDDEIQTFLKSIGPRELTMEEARKLHLMRIRAGKADSISGVIEILAAEYDKKKAGENKS